MPVGTLLLAASLALASQPAARPLSLLDVPFISQSEALCGGAAAAMVLRYWGDTAVTAEDFAALVDAREGGIRTADLARAVHARGSTAIAVAGTRALAQAELAAGRPVIALIEDRPSAFHYVVIVGWHDRAVVIHDPARTPYVVMKPTEFERKWKVAGDWMLAVAPGAASAAPDRETATPRFDPRNAATIHADTARDSTSCEALVADGVRLAQQNDLASAERMLADAAYECPGAAPYRELAGVRLLQRRWPEVRQLAEQAVAIDPSDTHAWQLVGASRYIGGDSAGALEAWNHTGEPIVDLVSASGLQRTTHRTVERTIGLGGGTMLTRRAFERAERRLDELPAAFSTRLEYVSRPGGRAEVRAHVAELPVVPHGRLTWAVISARAAALREIAMGLNSLARGGERVEARWRFWPHRPAYGVSLAMPASDLGIFGLDVLSERQPFTDPAVPDAERVSAHARLADWANGNVRWEVRGGLDRWAENGTFGVIGARTSVIARRTRITFGADTWVGDRVFATARVTAGWRSSNAYRGAVFVARGGVEVADGNTPLDLWPAGDTGHARAALVRAHPLVDGGRIDVERLGERLAHASGELQRWWPGPGALALGGALFVDAARASHRFAGVPLTDIDTGFGLRVAIAGHRGLFRLDFAHGLRDGRRAVSLVFEP